MKQTIKEVLDLAEWGMAILFAVVIGVAIIIWIHGSEALRVSVPWLIYTLVIVGCTAAVYWLATYAIARFFSTRRIVAEQSRDTVLARNEGRLSDISIRRSELHLEIEAAAGFAQLGQMQQGMVFASKFGESAFSSHTKAIAQLQDGVPFLGEPNIIRPILPELVQRQRVLIVGPSDSGKTTLLRHLIDAKGNCLVIDPHGTPPKWGKAKHIGQGRDYRAIGAALIWLIGEMDKRYEQLGTGEVLEGQHPKVTIIIDEWRAIVKNVKNAGEQIGSLLTEARKANMDLIVSTHSQMVKALGIEGEGDLRKGFTVVNLSGGNGEERRAALSTNGGDPVEYALPGPYNEETFNEQIAVKLLPSEVETMEHAGTILDLDVAPETEQGFIDQQVISEYLKTASYSAAYRLLYKLENGTEYEGAIGGNQTAKVKAILDKHHITHPISQ